MSSNQSRGPAPGMRHTLLFTALMALAGLSSVSFGQPVSTPADTASTTASALAGSGTVQALGLRVGHHGQYNSLSAFWQTPVWWSKAFSNGWGHVDLYGEAVIGYWDARNGKTNSMWQAGFAPFLRWWPTQAPFFVEAGFGPNVMSETRFAGYDISTALQFGSHIGMGYVFNKKHQVTLRASHFSNASIKQPNDGLNILQLDYAYRF